MLSEITPEEIATKLRAANRWWLSEQPTDQIPFSNLNERAYFNLFHRVATAPEPRRAVVLMGPRRVGKTVLVFHLFKRLLEDKAKKPVDLIYLDLQQPVYGGIGLEKLMLTAIDASGAKGPEGVVVCFDEIQYRKDWNTELKSLVDDYPETRFIGTGSAAAALRLKSLESGAGRFTDFFLPPLTFYEFLKLKGDAYDSLIHVVDQEVRSAISVRDITQLNELFIDYLNYGGYPESALSEAVQSNLERYIRNDIIDKVLLKDLPALYGIQDIPELNALFTTLAYNTSNTVSMESLSQKCGVAKKTLKKYIEYLESAFLLKQVRRVDQSGKRFQRQTEFKIYLTNPSMRAALFSPIDAGSESMGAVVETAVFSQWFHSLHDELHYARWSAGHGESNEVDLVYLDGLQRPAWAVEIKWSDAYATNPQRLGGLRTFASQHPNCELHSTTRTVQTRSMLADKKCDFVPAAAYCYVLGRNLIRNREAFDLEELIMPETNEGDEAAE